MSSHTNAQSWRHLMASFPARACKITVLPIILLFGAIVVPGISAQTLLMQFPFNDSSDNGTLGITTTTDAVSGVVLNMLNASGTPTDYHGGPGTGPAGIGNSLDFASATAGNGNNPIALTQTNSTVNFGTVGAFTV